MSRARAPSPPSLDLLADDLSEDLARVARNIGPDLTARILETFGGWRVYVPLRVTENCELARVIGIDATRQLSGALGAGYIWVPRYDAVIRRRRNKEIRTRLDAGEKICDVARAYGLSVRHVFKLRRNV